MSAQVTDIYIEQGYPYVFDIDFNLYSGEDLENNYECYFYNSKIGTKQFSKEFNEPSEQYVYTLELSSTDTSKVITNLTEYSVYAIDNITNKESKLLTGRIHLDKRLRG